MGHTPSWRARPTASATADTAALNITLDTTAPAVAITSAGGSTNQPALTISGTGEAGATVTLFDNGTPLQLPTVTVGPNGLWSANLTLSTGSNSLTAQATDAAGNTSPTSSAAIYTLNTTAPTGGTPDLVAGSDSGSSSTDNLTDVTAPSFTVALGATVVAGDTVQLLLGNAPLAHPVTHTITAADVTAGSVSLTVVAGDLGVDGSKAISAQLSDTFGNSSTTAALNITLDTTAPAVAITSAGGSTNQAGADDFRNRRSRRHGDAVRQRDPAATAHGDGRSERPVVRQPHAQHWQQLADRAGHRRRRQHQPHQQRGDLYAEHHGADRWHAGSGGGLGFRELQHRQPHRVTAPSCTVALGAMVVAGDTVQLLLGNAPLAHPMTHTITAADVTGSVSLTVWPATSGRRSKAISAQLSDTFGNSSTTAALNITLDTTAPAVAITSAGGSTNQPALTISGTGEAGATVTLFDNGTPLQLPTVTVGPNGLWSANLTLSTGSNSLTAQATDAAGNTSPTSSAAIYTLNTTAPTGGTPDLAADTRIPGAPAPTTSPMRRASRLRSAQRLWPAIRFAAAWQRAAGASGDAHHHGGRRDGWQRQPGGCGRRPRVDGSKAISAQLSDTFGNSSTTAALNITLDTTAPAVAITSAGGSTNQPALTISGTGEAGATVTLFDNGTPLQLPTVTVGPNGLWSANLTLSNGSNSLTAQATDAAGNTSPTSSAAIYTLNTTAPTGGTPDLVAARIPGASSTDNLTDVTAPSFIGCARRNGCGRRYGSAVAWQRAAGASGARTPSRRPT